MLRVSHLGKLLGIVAVLAVLALSGCGGGGSGNTSSGGPGKGVNVTIGSKKDPDGQLLAEMYALLLQKNGYNVTLKLALGDNAVLNNAIKSGDVDIYPEFTGTAIGYYNLTPTQDPKTAYQEANTYYKQNVSATWLDAAYNLNDSYGICTSSGNASKYNLATLDDLGKVSSQLTLIAQNDFTDPKTGILKPVATAYGLNFKKITTIGEESLGYSAVTSGQADVNECYTTNPAIVIDKFVLLQDTKNAFPDYNPAPVVRNALLQKSPDIATILNPLATKLTTDEQTKLIKQVSVDHTPLKEVAQQYLQQIGLL